MFEMKRDLLKMITIKKYNVDVAKRQYRKLTLQLAKERNYEDKAFGSKNSRANLP